MSPATSSPVQRKADATTPVQRKADAAPATPIGPRPSTVALFAGVQRKATGAGDYIKQIYASAQRGVATAAEPLAHTEQIQHLLVRHDIGAVQALAGGDAARASGGIEDRSTIEDLFGGTQRRASVESAPVQRTPRGVPFLQLGAGPFQRRASDEAVGGETAEIHKAAQRGISTPAMQLPHFDRIQQAFGRHDISGIKAHTGDDAAASALDMGAAAYATGDHVVLDDRADLHTVAHEAAHVIQQRGGVQLAGGLGAPGDAYEQHADAVADRVVRGESVEALLDRHAGGAPCTTTETQQAGGAELARGVRELGDEMDAQAARDEDSGMPQSRGGDPTRSKAVQRCNSGSVVQRYVVIEPNEENYPTKWKQRRFRSPLDATDDEKFFVSQNNRRDNLYGSTAGSKQLAPNLVHRGEVPLMVSNNLDLAIEQTSLEPKAFLPQSSA